MKITSIKHVCKLFIIIIPGYQGALRINNYFFLGIKKFYENQNICKAIFYSSKHKPSLESCEVPKKLSGPIGSAVLTFIGYIQTGIQEAGKRVSFFTQINIYTLHMLFMYRILFYLEIVKFNEFQVVFTVSFGVGVSIQLTQFQIFQYLQFSKVLQNTFKLIYLAIINNNYIKPKAMQ